MVQLDIKEVNNTVFYIPSNGDCVYKSLLLILNEIYNPEYNEQIYNNILDNLQKCYIEFSTLKGQGKQFGAIKDNYIGKLLAYIETKLNINIPLY